MNLIVRIIIFLYNFLFLPIISYIIFSNLIILIPILSFINLIAINIYFYLYFIMIINFNILAIACDKMKTRQKRKLNVFL